MALDHGFGDTALTVARQNLAPGGTITALHVHEAPQSSVRAFLDEEAVAAAFETTKARLEERIKDHPDVKPLTIKGHSGRTIIDQAERLGADLIVLGSHKPGLSDFLLGSTAARVVRHAPCAVHVLRTA
jgi:nucleotide-binding universal stress UspA family protein